MDFRGELRRADSKLKKRDLEAEEYGGVLA